MNKSQTLNLHQDKLKELGSYLREIRLKRSLSLENVAHKTKIQIRVLKAIEEARLESLPEPIYIKALIKQFADALELNGSDFASAFPAHHNLQGIQPSWKHVYAEKDRPFHLYWVYVLVVISAVSGLSLLVQRSNMMTRPEIASQDPQTNSSPEAVDTQEGTQPGATTVSNPPASENTTVTNAANATTNTENGQVVVSMTIQEDCWMKVIADGAIQYEGTLKKGEKRTWRAKEQVKVVAGNAGGVVIAINNEEAKPLGEPGMVEEVTYTSNEKTTNGQS